MQLMNSFTWNYLSWWYWVSFHYSVTPNFSMKSSKALFWLILQEKHYCILSVSIQYVLWCEILLTKSSFPLLASPALSG